MAGMVPYQELLQLLRHRDAELARLRELCQGKDTTVDFLKTKIARAAFSERGDHPAAEVQELQQRLQQSLEAQDAALRRQEELSLELQHAALEVDDLRAELKQARVEVGRLEAELQKVQLENQVQAHNGVPKESVLLAVEELERELAQDLTKTEAFLLAHRSPQSYCEDQFRRPAARSAELPPREQWRNKVPKAERQDSLQSHFRRLQRKMAQTKLWKEMDAEPFCLALERHVEDQNLPETEERVSVRCHKLLRKLGIAMRLGWEWELLDGDERSDAEDFREVLQRLLSIGPQKQA
ncbi:unnamed protein product, partial [Effrenium voratum]